MNPFLHPSSFLLPPSLRLRRYYVQAVDERSGEPCLEAMVEAADPVSAVYEAQREAAFRAGHLAVRLTQLAEQGVDAAGAVARALLAPERKDAA